METKMSLRDFAVVFLIWVPVGVNGRTVCHCVKSLWSYCFLY